MNIGFIIPIVGISLVLIPALHAMYKTRRESE